jgi:hypothetical protein
MLLLHGTCCKAAAAALHQQQLTNNNSFINCLHRMGRTFGVACTPRRAIKTLGLDPARAEAPPAGVHASVAAQLAWRYAQLLTALPQRGTEAEAWEACAARLYHKAGGFQGHRDIAQAFGDIHALQGQGAEGPGGVADLTVRRLLPCM